MVGLDFYDSAALADRKAVERARTRDGFVRRRHCRNHRRLRLSCNEHRRDNCYAVDVILGILSDTHGRAAIARVAIDRLTAAGATFFVHCGDVGDGVLAALPAGRAAFVLGNNDWNVDELVAEAARSNLTFLGTGGTLDLDGVRVAVTHGDDPRQVRACLASKPRCLFTGHTHLAHDRRENGVRRINPGALYRATRKTVATLDLTTDALAFMEIVG